MHIPKWLIATAGILFVVLIAAVAFFLGRETTKPPEAPMAASTAVQEPAATADQAPGEPKLPLAEPGAATTPAIPAPAAGTAAATPPIAPVPPAAPAPAPAADTSQATAEARARVAAYFRQMDAIQSGGTMGDPNAFATTIMQGAVNGDFAGLDDLVRAAGDAERRAVALQPPAECADYHRQALALLQESRTMMATLRDGLKRNDTDALTALGASAQAMQSRADTLAAAEKALRARFGL